MNRSFDQHRHELSWLAPTPLARQRVLERAGHLDRGTLAVAAMVIAVLLATAVFRDAWAFLPFGALLAAVVFAPLAIRRGARPELVEFSAGIALTLAMAVGAGVTGGTASPLVFLLPIGVVMNALRGVPASVAVCAVVTAVAFLTASLLSDPAAVVGEPLPTIAVIAMFVGVTVGSIALAEAELGHRDASIADPLTGLLNRHGLEERFEELRQQATVSAAPITFVLFDLDHFKRVNDEHGHDVGDELLREIAYRVRKTLRRFELVYRIGGEEFLVVLAGMEGWEGEVVAEQLRRAVEEARLRGEVGVTASFGVSSASGDAIVFERLYRGADQALYRAKRAGRDRVHSSGEALPA